MSYQEILLSILVTAAVVLVPMIYLFLKLFAKRSDLNIEKQRIELEIMRKSLENAIYNTNDKMASNVDRWKDINHMLFEAASKNIKSSETVENVFLESLSIKLNEIEIEPDRAFLLAPINTRFELKTELIKKACGDIGVVCETADEKFINGPILSLIVKKILSANIIIAVIDGRNANVFYELGLAHAFGKNVVMISDGEEDIPFDIQSQRMIIIDWDKMESIDKIRKSIAESMRWANQSFHRTR